MLVAAPPHRRLRLRVRGAVQGVGFRPFAFGLARKLELSGFVRNDSEGVLIEVEGAGASDFLQGLRREPPPLARIDAIEVAECAPLGDSGFAIDATRSGALSTRIGGDAAVCEDCLSELFDPASRFHKYPLVNCTHCGPRYTLTRALPYDRAQTSMAAFPMCEACGRDYADPSNRRFHAEPIACARCGPDIDAPAPEIARRIEAGEIVAVKGVGGFHLLCDARNEAAVARLRRRKRREAKPFAVMVLNTASAESIAELGAVERGLLTNRAAPIVLLRARAGLAPSLAPGLAEIGVMLPYAPLHWLIFHALGGAPDFGSWRHAPNPVALVATSANLGGEPLISDNAEAREKLAAIADLVVCHGRDIVTRADDSVMRVLDGAPSLLRRARGFVPEPIDLGVEGPCILAHGADLKNTVAVTRGREAFVSQHLGDLDDRATLRFRAETTRRLTSLIGVKPELVACDLHPDFLSTRSAEASGLPIVRVQHHVAHIAATAAERGWRDRVLGVALDGHGRGEDGSPWGGELLTLDGADWRRVGWLSPLALPGGDKAAREPWRMGVAMLVKLGREAEAARLFPGEREAPRLAAALQRGARAPVTTSLGRLFDAFAALAGTCCVQRYEGQAAMEFEALVRTLPHASPGDWRLAEGALDLAPFARRIIDERLSAREAAEGFHAALIEGAAAWIGDAARAARRTRIALGGGCLMNKVLTEGLCARLREAGFEVALPRLVPANDGGISFGQAALALRSGG
jgi:hydrogenase maturation protein HypF